MANTGVDGTLTLVGIGSPEGFTVEVHRIGWWLNEVLGTDTTDASGNYSIRYLVGPAAGQDLQVRVFDHVRRLIVESDVQKSVTDPVHTVDLTTTAGNALGWLARFGVLCTDGNQVDLLVDNEDAWRQLTHEVTLAEQSIAMGQLHFEVYSDLPAVIQAMDMITSFSPDPPLDNMPTTGTRLQEQMKLSAGSGIRVRLLLNDFILLPFPGDTIVRNQRYFEGTGVEVRGFGRWPHEGPMHAKSCVIDGATYFSLGSPFMQEYFDGREHKIDDKRRGTMNPLWNAIRVPIHDVSVRISGPHATVAANAYEVLWEKDANLMAPAPHRTGAPNPVQLVATLPGNTFAGLPEGETGIVEAYQRALANAEDFVYLENQYFTDVTMAEAIVGAIRKSPELQVIMALNPKVDLPKYGVWQTALIDRVVADLGPLATQIGFFSLWSHEVTGGTSAIIRNYIHSKVAVIDDAWATIGSANLDGLSLTASQYNLSQYIPWGGSQYVNWDPTTLWKARDRVKRAIEVNAVFYNAVAGLAGSTVPDELRRSLWAEHLGYATPTDPALTTRPADGWLGLWRRTAARKLATLNATPPTADPARILEGPFARPPLDEGDLKLEEAEFLVQIGIDPARLADLGVRTNVRSFDFDTGRWEI